MLPFDLHVLGLPPAFNLSHDQTLRYSKILIELLYSLFFSMSFVNLLTSHLLFPLLLRAHTDCPYLFLKNFIPSLGGFCSLSCVTTETYFTVFYSQVNTFFLFFLIFLYFIDFKDFYNISFRLNSSKELKPNCLNILKRSEKFLSLPK